MSTEETTGKVYACDHCWQLCEICNDRAEEAAAFIDAHPEVVQNGYGVYTCDECWENFTQTHVPDGMPDSPNVAPPKEIALTVNNVANWPKYKRAFDNGMIVADAIGRLRYPHGAPVGNLVLKWVTGRRPYYREATAEWFKPDSKRALEFVWPQ